MNQKQLTAVVALMTVALVGLTAIQVYWVRTALLLKQSQVQLSVQGALQNVVAHLESRESRASALQLVAQGNELQNNLASPQAAAKPATRVGWYAPTPQKPLNVSGNGLQKNTPLSPYISGSNNTTTEPETVTASQATTQQKAEPKPITTPQPQRDEENKQGLWRSEPTGKRKDAVAVYMDGGIGTKITIGKAAPKESLKESQSADNLARQGRWVNGGALPNPSAAGGMDARLRNLPSPTGPGGLTTLDKRPPPPFFMNGMRAYNYGFAGRADSAQAAEAIEEYRRQHRLMQDHFRRQFPFWAKVFDDSMLTNTESPEGFSINSFGQPVLPPTITVYGDDGLQYTDRLEFRVISPEDIIQRRKQEQEQKLQAEEALRYERIQRELQMRALRAKMDALRETLLEILYKPKNLRERVDAAMLDSLLGAELRANGIDQTYDWAVEQDNDVVLMPARMLTVGLQKQLYQYQVRLYPNDVQTSPYRLTLSLPTERFYVLKQVAWVVAVAGLFILCIVFGFVYSVRTILRQKKLSEMKTDFINNMTHEFKTPISTISLAAEAILEPRVQNNPQQMGRFTRIIQDENKRLQSQVERVLQMAEIDRGEMQLDLHEANANDLLNEVVQKIRLQVEKRGGTLTYENTAHTVRVQADPLHLSNVFLNLMDNAVKYSPDAPAIQVHAWNYGGKYCVSIADQGIGMSADTQKRIFEKFYRVPTGNLHDVKGFGLGLSYVKSIVMGHNGHIEVKSELGKGSRFTVTLPLMNTTGN